MTVKAGDRIRVLRQPYPGGPEVGAEGVVTRISPGNYPVLVEIDGRRGEQRGFHQHELEKIP